MQIAMTVIAGVSTRDIAQEADYEETADLLVEISRAIVSLKRDEREELVDLLKQHGQDKLENLTLILDAVNGRVS